MISLEALWEKAWMEGQTESSLLEEMSLPALYWLHEIQKSMGKKTINNNKPTKRWNESGSYQVSEATHCYS